MLGLQLNHVTKRDQRSFIGGVVVAEDIGFEININLHDTFKFNAYLNIEIKLRRYSITFNCMFNIVISRHDTPLDTNIWPQLFYGC